MLIQLSDLPDQTYKILWQNFIELVEMYVYLNEREADTDDEVSNPVHETSEGHSSRTRSLLKQLRANKLWNRSYNMIKIL